MSERIHRDKDHPYRTLGAHLRQMREKRSESVAEVSGAVEIDVTTLTDIERGSERPSEDILMLLMSHFAVKDDEAVKLWDMAGYDQYNSDEETVMKQVMVLPMDARIVYSDMAHIMVNSRGVVMNFMQEAGLGGQPLAVGRIGMSREQAKSVVELLQKALDQKPESKTKLLPPPEDDRPEPDLS